MVSKEESSAVWEDGHELRVRKTVSPIHYFLDVRPDLVPALRPFMDLPEMKAVWYPGKGLPSQETKNASASIPSLLTLESKEKGWIIDASRFPLLQPFLTHFHDILPLTQERKRDRYSAGLEHTPLVETRENRATLYNLTFQEVRLLALLFLGTENREELPKDMAVFSTRLLLNLDTLQSYVPWTSEPTSHMSASGDLGTLYLEDANFRQMCANYVVNRSGDKVRSGDILKLVYSDESIFLSAYDGMKFVPFEVTESSDIYILPLQFKVPAPFPATWWQGLVPFEVIHPNFEELAGVMEYMNEPEVPEEVKRIVGPVGQSPDEYIALRFSWQAPMSSVSQTYYIYCISTGNPSVKLTYEQVLENLEKSASAYQAISDTVMIGIFD